MDNYSQKQMRLIEDSKLWLNLFLKAKSFSIIRVGPFVRNG